MVSVYKMGGMSLGDIMKAEAEKKGVDVDAAMRLHSQYAAKAKSDGTAPKAMPKQLDSRYLSQNQAQHCWGAYNTYLQCLKKEGTDEACEATKWKMKGVCPWQWQEKWLEQRQGGFFPGVEGAPIPAGDDDEEDY